MNGLFFTSEPEATRDVLTDLLEFDHHDAGDGWILIDVPETTLGAHPLEEDHEPFHQMSFTCDNIEATVERIEDLGLEVIRPIEDKGFGITAVFELPGGVPVEVFEPRRE